MPPPMVEDRPDIGPQKGVRRPWALRVSLSVAQVQPGSTVTVMSSPETFTTRSMRDRSREIVSSLAGM